jgi:hypothetical protein
MAIEIEDLIRQYGTRFLADQNERAEADLIALTGVDASVIVRPAIVEYLKKLDIEVIFQRSPYDGLEYYRGLRREGRWISDHFPAWPFEPDTI